MRKKPGLTVGEVAAIMEKEHYHGSKRWHKEAMRLYRCHIAPRLGRIPMRTLSIRDISRLHASLERIPTEANRMLSVMSVLLETATSLGEEPGPGCSGGLARIKRYSETRRTRYATEAELGRILASLDAALQYPSYKAGVVFLFLMIFTGARPTELLRASTGQLTSRPDGTGFLVVQGKTGQRVIEIPAAGMRILSSLHPKRDVLCGTSTMPRRLWELICQDAGITEKLWVRDLRRTFGTMALSNGVELSQLTELLGHRHPQTTMIYAKLLSRAASAATTKVADHIAGLRGGHKVVSSVDPFA